MDIRQIVPRCPRPHTWTSSEMHKPPAARTFQCGEVALSQPYEMLSKARLYYHLSLRDDIRIRCGVMYASLQLAADVDE